MISAGMLDFPIEKKRLDHAEARFVTVRRRWDGTTLTDVREIFVADDWKDQTIPAATAGRMTFGRDGMLYVTVGATNAPALQGRWSRLMEQPFITW